jgi:glycine cleavage system transcriptional repressor
MASRKRVLVTVIGADRPGIVERVTRSIVDHAGNVEQSRMARLGGEFAAFVLVALPDERMASLAAGLEQLADASLTVTARPLGDRSKILEGYVPYSLHVHGADHEGIIHEFCELLAEKGVNIAEMATDVRNSPVSGTPMFSMNATLEIPGSLPLKQLKSWLTELADRVMVDAELRVDA